MTTHSTVTQRKNIEIIKNENETVSLTLANNSNDVIIQPQQRSERIDENSDSVLVSAKAQPISSNNPERERNQNHRSDINNKKRMKIAQREAEYLSPKLLHTFHFCFGFGFAIFGSVFTWILFLVWIFMEHIGGLGWRSEVQKVTASYFNWHPFCMCTAFLLFMTTSILSFEILPFHRYINKHIHWIANTFAFAVAMIGFIIILDCHQVLSDKGSFNSVHSVVGLLTLILFKINYLYGLIVYLLKNVVCLQSLNARICISISAPSAKSIHKRIGLLVLILGVANMLIGLQEMSGNLENETVEKSMGLLISVFLVLVLIGTVANVIRFRNKYDQNPRNSIRMPV